MSGIRSCGGTVVRPLSVAVKHFVAVAAATLRSGHGGVKENKRLLNIKLHGAEAWTETALLIYFSSFCVSCSGPTFPAEVRESRFGGNTVRARSICRRITLPFLTISSTPAVSRSLLLAFRRQAPKLRSSRFRAVRCVHE